jgi:hypothetical protein
MEGLAIYHFRTWQNSKIFHTTPMEWLVSLFCNIFLESADHSGRAFYGMNCLCPLKLGF